MPLFGALECVFKCVVFRKDYVIRAMPDPSDAQLPHSAVRSEDIVAWRPKTVRARRLVQSRAIRTGSMFGIGYINVFWNIFQGSVA